VRREQQEILEAAFTARAQAEQALRSTERRLERAREDFITTVSHELNTPLTPIKGYLHMLRSRDASLSPEQRQHCYAVMIDQAELLASLVQDLLGAAELQHVGFSVRMRTVEVREVIEKALQTVPPEAQHRFGFRSEGELGMARCDPVRLQQVIANLLSNAQKYSPGDQPVHLSACRKGDVVHIAVRDFGPGVAPELAEAVFDPFRRLGNSPTRGAGLGLHIARRLIEAMHGKIWLDTGTAPGALFCLTVPAVSADEPASVAEVVPEGQTNAASGT
jgi:two-component system sensor histidine kinase KdpD